MPDPSPLSLTVSGPRLRVPPDACPERDLRYGLGHLWQLSPTQVAVQVNRRPCAVPVVDMEDGADLFIIERLEDLATATPIPLLRNEPGVHPLTGRALTMVRYPAEGGFVPLGARLADGSPHPHAGTGFGLSVVLGYPADNSETRPEGKGDTIQRWELQQYRFDGRQFHIAHGPLVGCEELLPGLSIWRQPLGQAIADGADLIAGIVTQEAGGLKRPGLLRWRYIDGGWRPVAYHGVPAPDSSVEPSVIRDRDGALLMGVRTLEWQVADHLRAYRSVDGGLSWELWLDDDQLRSHAPVILQRTLDGDPFFITNPLRRTCRDALGRICHSTWMREDLQVFRLTDDRRHVQIPYAVFDGRAELGPARRDAAIHVNFWYLDHPIATNVRLADGRWHTLVPFRVCETWDVCTAQPPSAPTGFWLEELLGGGETMTDPPWRFD